MSDEIRKPRAKVRGNGMGCAYQRPGEKTWTVEVVTDWLYPHGDITKPKRPVRKKKGGFPTKKAALEYAAVLRKESEKRVRKTLQEVYKSWKAFYESRVDASTMACYTSAYNHFSPLHGEYMDDITSADLQTCMDDCPAGKRTHQNMRTTAGLLWHYAMDQNIIDRDITKNLYTGKGKSKKREALTEAEVTKIKETIGTIRYAEYIYCLCYLGYRPGELLELRKEQVTEYKNRLFIIEGKKTDAGIDRAVPVHQNIEEIIRIRLFVPGTDLLFPQYQFAKISKEHPNPAFLGFKSMTDNYFREMVFKPMMQKLGIAEGKVPYAARHTFSNKLKKADGADADKAALIGHTDYAFTQKTYQSSDYDDLISVMDSIK